MASNDAGKDRILAIHAEDHVVGSPDAVITVVSYCDFVCPYCRRAYGIIKGLPTPIQERLRYVFRHFPLREKHPYAQQAAEIAEAASAQGRFWPIHDFLYLHQDRLDLDDLHGYAVKVGLDVERLKDEVASRMYAARVERDRDGGRQLGVTGTPTLFYNEIRHTDEETLEQTLRRAA